jgi:hypothetical protein
MPRPDVLQRLAAFLHVPLETVVLAAARDAGYLRPRGSDEGEHEAPTMRDHG